ncbi:MAG: hypothetical protein U0805_21100 [Pirellulales bacterium]
MARKQSQSAIDDEAWAYFVSCDSSLSPSGTNSKHARIVSRGVIEYWRRAAAVIEAARANDQEAFKSEYAEAIRIAKAVGPHFKAMRDAFTNANTAHMRVSVEFGGRRFTSAHQCLYDLADGVIMATAAANDSLGGTLLPIRNWKRLQHAIASLPEMDLGPLVDIASRECALIPEVDAPPPPLVVDLEQQVVILKGTRHDITSPQAVRWIKVLADRVGQWVSGSDLVQFDNQLDGVRTDRLRKYLPPDIDQIIESRTGGGSRINLT